MTLERLLEPLIAYAHNMALVANIPMLIYFLGIEYRMLETMTCSKNYFYKFMGNSQENHSIRYSAYSDTLS